MRHSNTLLSVIWTHCHVSHYYTIICHTNTPSCIIPIAATTAFWKRCSAATESVTSKYEAVSDDLMTGRRAIHWVLTDARKCRNNVLNTSNTDGPAHTQAHSHFQILLQKCRQSYYFIKETHLCHISFILVLNRTSTFSCFVISSFLFIFSLHL